MDKKPNNKRGLYILNISVIAAVILGITVFINTAPRPTESNEENRDLAKCPPFSVESYFNGTFTEGFSAYFNDAVPMRSTWKRFISDFRSKLGIEYDDGVTIV
ncbi:MAG: hypothetical protein ACI4QY_06995 [Oscillospiraceae bacterium]